MSERIVTTTNGTIIEEPLLARLLFSDKRFAWIWVAVRVFLGVSWLDAASHKLSNPDWMETGVALKGFWTNAVANPEQGRPAIAYGWYRDFIQYMLDHEAYVWFAKLIAIGELTIGIFLIIGAFVGIVAFFAGFMNWNFIMAGSASTNGLLFVAAVLLILAWKVAGYWGADRYLLPWLGTPWRGRLRIVDKTPEQDISPSPSVA